MKKIIQVTFPFVISLLLLTAFSGCNKKIENNSLKLRPVPFKLSDLNCTSDEYSIFRQMITFKTDTILNAVIEYWEEGAEDNKFISDTSVNTKHHQIKLLNLNPETKYHYKVILNNAKEYSEYEIQSFTSRYIPVWLDSYYTPKENTIDVDGKLFIYKRKSPGVLVMLDSKGQIEWYQAFDNFLKTATYTKNNTFLCILSDPGYKTAYGNHLVELNYKGDTLVHFKKGIGLFNKTIHHDLLLDSKDNVVVLTNEYRKFDLSDIGGTKNDSIAGDGIQIFSKEGEKIWEWSVFDVKNPKADAKIMKDKDDWLHANSFCFDKDSNLLVSFYKASQIWKINSKTGELIWVLGENGDFELSDDSYFAGQHSIHINRFGHLMIFDNGLNNKISRAVSYEINESEMTAKMIINAPLPEDLHSPRMGSAYLIDNDKIIQCSTNNDKIAATDLQGNVLWQFDVGGLTYRAIYVEN